MPNWTEEQKQAISTEGKNIIVSAGAGSGKTAVLTERVIRKIKSGIHINNLLVLTFTNAAAKEMKERIRKAIIKNKDLKEELDLLDSAFITTFDSFALSVVKKYHTKLNITNNIKITDEVLISIEKKKLLEEIFTKYYENEDENFIKLITDFCLKDDKELKNYILNIYKKIELKYDKEIYLDNYINNEFTNEKLNSYIDKYISLILNKINSIKEERNKLDEYLRGDYLKKLDNCLDKLYSSKTYDEILKGIDIDRMPSLPRGTIEDAKQIKENISKIIKDIKTMMNYKDTDEIKEEILSTKDNVSIIIDIIKELDHKLSILKQTNNMYSFTDIAIMAIKVVEDNPDIKEELTNSFNEILVDEYQDTSDIQEKFISLIANNNVYMVGDIKQSIYRFRNANPYIFKNKYDTYRDTDQGIKIDLNKNFRSRNEVIDNINLLFELFMDDNIGGADYKTSHKMIFGNNTYLEEGKTNQNYNLDILVYEESTNRRITKEEQEIFIVGEDIKNKINNNYLIFDKDTKELRPIQYKDIAILLDKSKYFDLYKKIFEYLQIPITIYKDEELKKDQDISILSNLIKLIIHIKNKEFDQDFKYSFISISRSFLFKTSDQEIYDYYINNNYNESEVYKICEELSKDIDVLPIEEFIYKVLERFNYDLKTITKGDVNSYLVREEYFYNLLKDFSLTNGTIYDFSNLLDTLFEDDYDLKFSINTDNSNSCKIMTIHKSKGLEFPVCYFGSFYGKFNINELREKIIFDNEYGIILPKVDNYYKDTILKVLLKSKLKKEEISEKIRLLYVALTRAKEKMIIVLPKQEEVKEVFDIVSDLEREKYSSFLDIMKSIYSILLPYIKELDIEVDKKYLLTIKDNNYKDLVKEDNLVVEELETNNEVIEENKYSKESLKLISDEEKNLLEFGTKVHEVLEQINFKEDISKLNIDEFILTKINDFINTDLIKNNINNKMYKEYEFIYKEDNKLSHGSIDLLIEDKDKMIIIDYKLKNIDDIAYDKQLNGYREFITNKTNKKVECYLYSIIDNKFREVL